MAACADRRLCAVLTGCFVDKSLFGRLERFVADLFAGSVAGDRLGESAAGELGAVEGVEDEAVGRLDVGVAAVGEAQLDGRDVGTRLSFPDPVRASAEESDRRIVSSERVAAARLAG